jgi:hypothetical protein
MALKRYVCHVHPNLRIGNQIKFEVGFFETTSAFLQRSIEKNDLWGARIFEIPALEDVSLPKAPANPEMDAAVAAVMDVNFDDLVDDESTEETPEEIQEKVADLDPTPTEPWNKGISATDVNKMKVGDLKVLAAEMEVELPEDAKVTAARLRRAIRLKLGV